MSPGGEKIIFAMGDEAGDATWDDVDHFKEFRLYLPRVDQNVPRVSPGDEKIIFAMGDEAGDATWDDVDHFKEFRLYLPTYNNDHELTFY